mmetsp:Transcript_21605/g.32325  ORF Transcript_21605/g.32325 Transcript_21605/m.32325 type:complete len:81 (-) Transcript_21605:139-381(-)
MNGERTTRGEVLEELLEKGREQRYGGRISERCGDLAARLTETAGRCGVGGWGLRVGVWGWEGEGGDSPKGEGRGQRHWRG